MDPKTTLVTGENIAGPTDLARVLASRKAVFYRCVTEKLLTYALGRGLEPADAVTVERIADRLGTEGGKFSVLLMGIVESPPFQTRRGDSGEPPAATRTTPPPPKRATPAHKKGDLDLTPKKKKD